MIASTDARADDLPRAVPALWRTFKLGYRAEPKLLLASLVTTVLTMLPDALLALWMKMLTDGILSGSRTEIVWAALALAVSVSATWYVSVLNERMSRRFRDRLAIAMESHIARLQATVATVDHQERPELIDRLAVLRDASFTLDHLFQSLLSNAALVLRLVIVGILLGSIHPLLALLLVAGLPAVLTSVWRPGVERAVEESVASHDRLARHLFLVGTTAGPAKEVRVTGIASSLRARRSAARERWRAPIAATRWRSAVWSSLGWAVFGIAYVIGIAWVARGLDRSVGDVVLVVVAGQRLSIYIAQSVTELGFLRGVWMDSSLRLMWLEDYAATLDEHATAEPPDRIDDGIRFEHVSFRYPGTDRLALDEVDVLLPAGAVVAIVGENGAGKSTLVKLLSGMYRPTSGRVTVDGVDIATMSTAAWRARMAGAFQDFFRFELMARHSVGVGDEPRLDDEPAVVSAVDRAGAVDVIERLPAGLATQLGPTWDDGVEVSFGQWQKVALARGFMRDDPLVLVLDEPTAALDAETEHALFERYADAARDGAGNGRITVLVSHRFSTVRMADLIVVLDGARVVEVGRHDELLAKGGQYAELFQIQAGAYR
jgi:ATP-binding cassette, subfamily B, bacterial